MPPSDRAGQPATPADLVDVPKLVTAYYAEHPDVGVAEQRVVVRHLGPPRVVAEPVVQLRPHRRHQPGDLRLPRAGRHRRPAVPRPGHARAVRAGVRATRWRCSPATTCGC